MGGPARSHLPVQASSKCRTVMLNGGIPDYCDLTLADLITISLFRRDYFGVYYLWHFICSHQID